MKDTKEIVLFFKEKYQFSNIDIASQFKDRFDMIGEPTILPVQPNLPRILFNSNPDFLVNVNEQFVSFAIAEHYFENVSTYIFDIIDIFEEEKIYFAKIGYISSIFLSPKSKDIVKNKYINIEMNKDFNISWYTELEMKNNMLNCWERLIAEEEKFDDLLIQFDINTKIENEIKFDMKFIKEFISVANAYIEEKIEL